MGVRFRRRIRLAPGLHLNVSGSGLSLSAGPRGASVTLGGRGAFLNAGIPGTGLYARERFGAAPSRSAPGPSRSPGVEIPVGATVAVDAEGAVSFVDTNGDALPDQVASAIKRRHRDQVMSAISGMCERINAQIESIGRVHLDSPAPAPLTFIERPFDQPMPARPQEARPNFWQSLFSRQRERVEQRNAEARREYEGARDRWQRAKEEHEAAMQLRRRFIEHDIRVDPSAMEQHLEAVLAVIHWPRETQVSLEVMNGGTEVRLDVDLPELENMPTKTASIPTRGLKLSVKELTAAKVRMLYMDHIHGVVFRIVAETFAALPIAQTVLISGYSQRPDKSTGQIVDQYLISVRVKRDAWAQIDFSNLAAIDIVEALARFDLRRSITKTANLDTIEPFTL